MENETDYIAPDVDEYFMTLQKNQNPLEESRFLRPQVDPQRGKVCFLFDEIFCFSLAVGSQSFEHIHHVKTR